MRANHVEYHAPATFDDLLEVFVRVARVGRTSVVWEYAASATTARCCARAEQMVVQIDLAQAPAGDGGRRLPRTRRARSRARSPRRSRTARPAAAPARSRPSSASSTASREADEILRQSVATIAKRFETFCGVRFVEDGGMIDGPSGGDYAEPQAVVPITYDDSSIAEIVLGTPLEQDDRDAFDRIAKLLSPFCLVGWDTGGEAWNP